MAEMQDIQWFPGHMTKTKRKMQENIKMVDAVAEIVDARIPFSSRNPDLDQLLISKPRLIILNKSDIADAKKTSCIIDFYKRNGVKAIAVECKKGNSVKLFIPAIKEILKDKIDAWNKKGLIGRNIKVMIVGVPNVGKSSFINKISKNKKAKVEDRPGVTRGNQWFSIDKNFDLLDTPGVLWPKFQDQNVAMKLAFTGAVKDQILDTEMLACNLLEFLSKDYFANLKERYKIENIDILDMSGLDLLNLIGKKRGMLISGGEIDRERAAIMILDEFRAGKLGRITLDEINEN